ncbi:hypothetical protein [Spongiactinospora sp. 9N601]|uniref:hypothetical protein n=1 Tax=Spongiactinospora sp. 9N601 TaxID=3375149 RepID=UPI0037A4718A
MPPQEDGHFAEIITPGGSHVVMYGITAAHAADVAARHAPEERGPDPTPQVAAEPTPCTNCQGAGGWFEEVITKTPSGGTVITKKWIACRPCKSTGQIPPP